MDDPLLPRVDQAPPKYSAVLKELSKRVILNAEEGAPVMDPRSVRLLEFPRMLTELNVPVRELPLSLPVTDSCVVV